MEYGIMMCRIHENGSLFSKSNETILIKIFRGVIMSKVWFAD